MLTRTFFVRTQFSRLSRAMVARRHNSSSKLDPRVVTSQDLRLPPHQEKGKQREPFAKNFFLGKYDVEFCAFPEPQSHERHGEFFEWLKPIEEYVESIDIKSIDEQGQIPAEVLENLRELGVFRAAVPEEYGGLGLNTSEFGKLVETVATVPVLGAYLVKKGAAVDFVKAFASAEQKAKYLPRIVTGDVSPTVAITEDDEGSSDTPIFAHVKVADNDDFLLNGKKSCVIDARNSNLFIVVCEYSDTGHSFKPEETLSAFLVEKSFGGVTVGPPLDTTGLRGLDMCEVKFNNTKIPKENLIGDIGSAAKEFPRIFGEGKQYIGGQTIALTRKFLRLLVQHLKNDEEFVALKFKNHVVQDVIGKMCGTIFAMESAFYLTTGMMDNFENQDCEMEKCMVETFCAEECVENIFQGLQLVGISAYMKSKVFQQLLRDATCLTSFDGTVLNTKAFIAMLGLKHTGEAIHGNVKIRRNPLQYPAIILKSYFKFEKTPDLEIAFNLHPSLKVTAELLEYGVARLKDAIEKLMVLYGREVFEKLASHKRLTELATYLYVMGAIVARTSRSYCLGMRDAEREVQLTQVYGYILHERIKRLADQLEDCEWVNGDIILEQVSDIAFEKDGYFIAHPLARNF